jgi:hypothetical protein
VADIGSAEAEGVGRRSLPCHVGKNRGGGVQACGPWWAGYSGPSLKNSPPFYYSKFFKSTWIDSIKQ